MSCRISIVTPNYNMDTFLESTLLSVIDNLEEGDEYFIVDGGSTDTSRNIIKRYDSNITKWISEKDDGYADALAKGLSWATGDILCWINSGDLLLAGTFSQVRKIFCDHKIDFIFGDDFYIDDRNKIIQHSSGYSRNLRTAMLYGGWTPLQDACFWRKDAYEYIGGINRNLKYAADYDLFLRMAFSANYQYVPLTFSAFRRHVNQKSIHGKLSYTHEREFSRKNYLESYTKGTISDALQRFYQLNKCRIKARFYPIIANKRTFKGKDISLFQCGKY